MTAIARQSTVTSLMSLLDEVDESFTQRQHTLYDQIVFKSSIQLTWLLPMVSRQKNWPCSFLLWGEVIAIIRISDPIYSIKQNTLCLKKRGVELFAITSSTVNWCWKFFHCWKQQWISCKI